MKNKFKKEREINSIMKNALASDMEPDDLLNQKIMNMWKENSDMNKTVKRKLPVAAIAVLSFLLMTVTVGATVKYMTSEEIAERNGYEDIAQAFRGEEAIETGEVREAGDYQFTLLGVTTGKALNETGLKEIMPNIESTYVTVAIERLDGKPMPETSDDAYRDLTFFMSPLIQGLKPWNYNAASMNGGYSDFTENGILYRIVECNDVKQFADKKIYFCISDSSFFDINAYNYDETSGEITRNEDYEGINLLFDLPFDVSDANPAAAAEYLKNLEESWSSDVTGMENGDEKEDEPGVIAPNIEEEVKRITSYLEGGKFKEALDGAELVEGSKKTVKRNEGCYEYQWFTDTGEDMGTLFFYEENLKGGKDFMVCYAGFDESLNQPTELNIIVLTDDGKGTADIQAYVKKL